MDTMFYMRPREPAVNEATIKAIASCVIDITCNHPLATVILCGDLNREESLAELYI